MSDNQFDQFIRAKLKDHSAPVPPGLWEKIKPDEKDDRKGFVLPRINTLGRYMIALALLGAFAVGGYLYLQPATQQPSTSTSISATATRDQQHAQEQTVAGSESASSNNNVAENSNAIVQNNTLHNNNTPNESNNNNELSLSAQITPGNTAYKNAQAAGINYNSHPASQEQASPIQSASDDARRFNLLAAAPLLSDRNSLLYDMKDLKNLELMNAVAHTRRVPNMLVCPSARGGRYVNPDWYVEMYASPDLAFKSEQNVSATPQYMQRKDSSESSQLGFSVGVRLVKPFSDNLVLKAGLQYGQINQQFTYRSENEIKTTTVITQRQIIRGPGDTVLVNDTSVLRQIGYRNNTVTNHFRTIDVPVTIGYQFGRDEDDFRVGVNAGVIFNLSSWYQGVVLDKSLATVPIDKASTAVYKSNIGMGLYTSISFMKRLGENSQLFFEPYFRYNLSNITADQAAYTQKFHVGGLSIGLRYNLNRR
ncbi:Outer membrane protein beta-barrel domain-containing protein [Hydrobacter penzbergensis]|uniref:Outer membrane protein beta-barrel domain-containing protein n=1 Tax=Hydrobacter penzbergensis TaxID=1235997 RepID=A0A8X8IDG2_9BACT|nr:outer membrane beta-barrel protein [Hydrobacter penzbergensis]SDW12898.1 Outer membrane protein beta-barrel domain-containing protein [Hydrobacter penzbergensis]